MPADGTMLKGEQGDRTLYPISLYWDKPELSTMTRRMSITHYVPLVVVITQSGDFGVFGFMESLLLEEDGRTWYRIYDDIEKKEIHMYSLPNRPMGNIFKLTKPSRAKALLFTWYKSHTSYPYMIDVASWLYCLWFFRTKINCSDWYQASAIRSICEMYGYNLVTTKVKNKQGYKYLKLKCKRKYASKIKTIIRLASHGTIASCLELKSQGFPCRYTTPQW
jgi:hypothetical protein